MVWFKVDDGFYSSRKVLSIPRPQRVAAVGLWTLAGNWSGRELTDGRVDNYVLAELGATPRLRRALVEARLWLDHGPAGVEFHDWAKYQPTREQVEEERAKAAARQAKWRDRHSVKTDDEHVSNGVTDTVTNGGSNDAPTRPDPTRPNTPSSTKKGAATRATRIPDPFLVNERMRDWARDEVPGIDVDRGTRMFVDHFRAASGPNAAKKDWVAAWRNWLRKDYGNLSPAQRSVSKPPKLGGVCDHRFVGGFCAECSERET